MLSRALVHSVKVGALVGTMAMLAFCTAADRTVPLWTPREFIVSEPGLPEQEVRILPLMGPLLQPEAEISGLAWHGDILVLLPQYPHKWDHSLFGLHKADLARAIVGESDLPLEPFPIPLHGSHAMQHLEGYEGLEAIVFVDHTVYLLSEANMKNYMQGYLLTGTVLPDRAGIAMNMTQVAVLATQTGIMNQSYEALIGIPQGIASVFEANGTHLNQAPNVLLHGPDLVPQPAITMPHVEYRLTDATAVNAAGEFWMFNFHWPGSKRLMPQRDPIAEQWGEGPSQIQSDIVERILKFRLTATGVELVDAPPLELQLLNNIVARNWEGIARWEDAGFLIATDRFPTTVLAYVSE